MHRPSWSRALSALFALWFTVYTVEPAALHACDVHDAPRATAAAGTTHAHATHAAQSDATPETGQPSDGNACCTCPGDCATPSPVALTAAHVALVVPTATTSDTGLADYEYAPVAAAHVLPFANGPPSRA